MNIIGAGPAGLFAAYSLAKAGIKATVHEEDPKIGIPDHCAGLISKRLTDIIPKGDYIIQSVDGARIISGGSSFELHKKGVAYVVDRPKMDKFLADLALSAGATIKLNHRAHFMDFTGAVIDASGAGSLMRSHYGQQLKVLPAIQYRIKQEIDTVEAHLTPLAPEFFAWAVPEGDNCRVGLAAKRPDLDSFVKSRFGSPKILSRSSGAVIVGGPVKRTVFGHRLLLGDAAGQVKAMTGGGVVMSLLCAQSAASAIIEGDIGSYERLWREKVGRELSVSLMVRKFMNKVDREKFVRFCSRNSYLLEQKGDMDFHSSVVLPILTRPSNWPHLAGLLADAIF